MKKNAILWFRNDLRVRDHYGLAKASKGPLLPVYVLDEKILNEKQFGVPRMSYLRLKFLLQSIIDLRKSLENLGATLIFRIGDPVQIITELQKQVGASCLYTSLEVGTYESQELEKIEDVLAKSNCLVETYWHSTLYHIDDLPWSLSNLPQIFTQFRKAVEKEATVQSCSDTPQQIFLIPGVEPGNIPTPEELGFKAPEKFADDHNQFVGGEKAAWQRLEEYFWKEKLLDSYKETRNELLGKNFSSKFSPWLALGCISPKSIYFEVQKYEKTIAKNESTYWLIFELIWRDYFKFIAFQYGASIFRKGGIKGQSPVFNAPKWIFDKWTQGETGIPFVDANMKELLSTGFMSNRGRQNVASFLVKDLKVDWRWGAAWFESQLLDYDVASNWGNWNYVAGVGNDPREDRYFNIFTQAKRYDPKANYIKHWISSLKDIPTDQILLPKQGLLAKVGYPAPIINPEKWIDNRK
jgi:deoxyribodipyrimidine photo-lyase